MSEKPENVAVIADESQESVNAVSFFAKRSTSQLSLMEEQLNSLGLDNIRADPSLFSNGSTREMGPRHEADELTNFEVETVESGADRVFIKVEPRQHDSVPKPTSRRPSEIGGAAPQDLASIFNDEKKEVKRTQKIRTLTRGDSSRNVLQPLKSTKNILHFVEASPSAHSATTATLSRPDSNLGNVIGGQLGELMAKAAHFKARNKVVPIKSEGESGARPPPSTRKKTEARALIGNGTAEDAEKSAFSLVMIVSTIFALWGLDIYEAAGPPPISSDPPIYTIVTIVFALFVVEFLFYTLFKPGYLGSFFFFLDFLSAISLLPDVLQLWSINVFGSAGGGGLAVARAGRAARAGTRAARVVRIFKLFSLLRRRKAQQKKTAGEQSRIGSKLSEGVTQKVIIIVALMLISTQLLDIIGTANIFANETVDLRNTMKALEELYIMGGRNYTSEPFRTMTANFIDTMNVGAGARCPTPFTALGTPQALDTSDCVVRYLRFAGKDFWGNARSYADLRRYPTEILDFYISDTIFVADITNDARSASLVNIVTVAFITIVLGVSSTLINRDSDRLVIRPLEMMAGLVQDLARDPLNLVAIDKDEEEGLEAEILVVAHAIKKLSQMLQVGFGEAGATIIQAVMADDGKDANEINPVIPGRRIQGIYGFCDIRNFTDCTECLQTDVMVFVNRISDFVHRAVKDNEGAPNKNIGDAFLLVWTLPERRSTGGRREQITTADSALKAFVRIIVETAADPQLAELTSRKVVQDRIPGYAVRMGCGLHVGWSIEGAIGSVLKIDATYLSPNVNMCARLEGATKAYGCVLLFTDAFYDLLTPPVQKLCRRVDRVTVRGSNVPFDLYTFDSVRSPDPETMFAGETFWEKFPPTTSPQFRQTFAAGVKHYIDGLWEEARPLFEECLQLIPTDGPTKFLYNSLKECDFTRPANWPHYRINGVD